MGLKNVCLYSLIKEMRNVICSLKVRVPTSMSELDFLG